MTSLYIWSETISDYSWYTWLQCDNTVVCKLGLPVITYHYQRYVRVGIILISSFLQATAPHMLRGATSYRLIADV